MCIERESREKKNKHLRDSLYNPFSQTAESQWTKNKSCYQFSRVREIQSSLASRRDQSEKYTLVHSNLFQGQSRE